LLRSRQLLDAASGVRALVVGDAMLDRYLTGSVRRISPEAPVPVLRVEEERSAPGGAANVAAGVAALGAACDLVAVTGADEAADELEAHLGTWEAVRPSLVRDPERPTTVKTRVLARHQQMLRVDRESAAPLQEGTREALLAALRERLPDADILVLVDYDKGALGADWLGPVIEEAAGRGVPAVVDPKLRNFFACRGAFLFKPNGSELAAARGAERPPRSADELRRVRERLGCRHLLVTLGEEGMVLLPEGEEEPLDIPSRAREVYDVSGAGDTVTAVVAVALAAGAGVAEAARLSNFAAGIEVSHLGAVPVSRDELRAAIEAEEKGGAG
ncbi:MAG TPA: PfkB family carbohydrate kinase, partial [Gemmatimonadota bacterium]|nr:PfkB family carbohydrate kinase [Gemmatimonadota bacterium]